MAEPGPLRLERQGPLARVTLARPERRNAFDRELIEALARAFRQVGDARVVVLAGEGESFCAGADVEWMQAAAALSYEENLADALSLHEMLETVDSCPAPVLARVQGHAFGGGLGLVCASDVVVAAEDAVFAFSEVRLGLIPAVVSPFVLSRIGPGPARRYFLTGERFGADVALRIGLVHEVVPEEQLDKAVDRLAAALLAGGPQAVRAAKRLVLDAPLGGAEAAARLAERRVSAEAGEGLRAFLERRPPRWREQPPTSA